MPYVIRGTVQEGGSPAVRTVRLYSRDTGELIAEDVSSTSGEFEFLSLPEFGPGELFTLVCLDDEAGTDYNAIVYDRVEAYFETVEGAHRYWRITGIDLGGSPSYLEISELRVLSDSVDVTDDATKSASDAVTGGTFSDLFDGVLTSRCYWFHTIVDADFWIQFDFGEGGDVLINGVKQGGFDQSTRYMVGFSLEYSDDGSSWTELGSKSGLTYPGNFTLSSEYSFA